MDHCDSCTRSRDRVIRLGKHLLHCKTPTLWLEGAAKLIPGQVTANDVRGAFGIKAVEDEASLVPAYNCHDCKDRGVIVLFISVVPCHCKREGGQ